MQPASHNPDPQPPQSAPPPSFDFSAPQTTPSQPFGQSSAFDTSSHGGVQNHPTPVAKEQKGGVWGILIALGAIFLKFGKFLTLLKFGKLFTTMGSMLISIWFYALAWGWQFAVGFVLLIFVHEMGHVFAAKWQKIPVSAPMFIPGLGALITMKENPRDALTEAYIGYGGPLLGTIGAVATWGLYYLTGNDLFLALATTAFMLNLFNMVPVSPLDGGRITAALSPWLWGIGLIGLLAWFLTTFNPIMLIILLMGAFRFWGVWKKKDTEYFEVPPQKRLLVAGLYISLAIFLAWSQHYTHNQLEAWRRSHPSRGSLVVS
ncbi:MAG TPA: site-2 protease family protein [Abditibacteriaceae bacterium]|jgi:Zn-dependent protease